MLKNSMNTINVSKREIAEEIIIMAINKFNGKKKLKYGVIEDGKLHNIAVFFHPNHCKIYVLRQLKPRIIPLCLSTGVLVSQGLALPLIANSGYHWSGPLLAGFALGGMIMFVAMNSGDNSFFQMVTAYLNSSAQQLDALEPVSQAR